MPSAGAQVGARGPFPAPQASGRRPVTADTTFRRLLGDAAWQRLDPNVRARFAVKPALAEVFTFAGEMAVVRRSRFGWLLAHLCRLIGRPLAPHRGRDVPTVVRIYADARGAGIVWERRYDFGGRRPVVVSSTKRPDPPDGLLECVSCGFAMRLRIFESGGALHFASTGYCVDFGRWRLPVPRLLTPGDALVVHRDEGGGWFRFTLRFLHPLLGETYFQDGCFRQVETAP